MQCYEKKNLISWAQPDIQRRIPRDSELSLHIIRSITYINNITFPLPRYKFCNERLLH